MTPEGKIVKEVTDYLREAGMWYFRYPASTTFGMPDIIIIYKGYFVGAEIKRDDGKGKATLLQIEVINSIKKAGGFAGFVDSISSLKNLLKEVDTVANSP